MSRGVCIATVMPPLSARTDESISRWYLSNQFIKHSMYDVDFVRLLDFGPAVVAVLAALAVAVDILLFQIE